MTALPIVERELRVAARRRATYWTRCGFALGVLALAMWVYGMSRRGSPAELSVALFYTMTIAAGLFCLIAGAHSTADCLSEEKRDGTLGLLFLTDLRGYDVVAGKLVANSLNAIYGVLAILPMLAIPLLMGGVSAAQFGRISLVLLNTLFFSLAVGMFVSSFATTARASVSWTVVLIVGFVGGLPLTGALLAEGLNWHQSTVEPFFLLPTPGYAYAMGLDSEYRTHAHEFWISLLLTHIVAWLALVLACLITPRSWQDRPASATRLRWRDRWARWSLGESGDRASYRARLLDVNAFFWLAARSRVKPALVWATLGVLSFGWFWAWLKYGSDWAHPGWLICTLIVLNTMLKFWFTAEACAQISEDRRIGALELLLSTPLSVPEIIAGQGLALRRQFLGPVIFVGTLHLVFLFAGLSHRDLSYSSESRVIWVFVCLSGLIVLLADLVALFYVGLWSALTARNTNRASGQSLTRILALPWILFAVFMMFLTMTAFRGGGSFMESGGVIFIWLFIGLGVDFFFGIRAKVKLEEEFRAQAMARYAPAPSLWQRLFGNSRTP